MQEPAVGLSIEGRPDGRVALRAMFGGDFEYVMGGDQLIDCIRRAMQKPIEPAREQHPQEVA